MMQEVREIMSDGEWHTAREIVAIVLERDPVWYRHVDRSLVVRAISEHKRQGYTVETKDGISKANPKLKERSYRMVQRCIARRYWRKRTRY